MRDVDIPSQNGGSSCIGASEKERQCNDRKCVVTGKNTFIRPLQGYSYDQRLEYVDIDFNVPHTPIVGLGQ